MEGQRFEAVKCVSSKKGDKATVSVVVMEIHLLWLMAVHKEMRVSESSLYSSGWS